MTRALGVFVLMVVFGLGGLAVAAPGDEHWSLQFKKPRNTQSMSPATGLADGNTKPKINRVKWHDGKLWMAGKWDAGVSARDMRKRQQNESWHLWTWSPTDGYEVHAYFHNQNGGAGPDNQIDDFLFLPDGRIVVGGGFQRVENLTGTRYHRVNGIAVYDPKEPTANRWRPLGSFQYNGTVSETGSVHAIAYDPKGNGLTPKVSKSTARFSPGIATWQEGKGWTTFPREKTIHHEDTLQRAGDFMHFDSVHVLDFLLDGEDLWIVGAFSGGKKSGETLRGIAKWDAAGQKWIDPTGKGGVGREVWSIAKADNGKIYFAGSFGGRGKGKGYFEGFKNGDPAASAMSFDPATGEWAQLGSGLATLTFPEVRMTVAGNEHWSRGFGAPPRRKRPDQPAHTATTGMDAGTGPPDTVAMGWLGDTLYFAGNYPATPKERWYVWSYNAERGWEKLGWEEHGKVIGPDAAPRGMKIHDGKVWVFGGLPKFKGLAIYDPAAKTWSPFKGTFKGKEVIGHAVAQGGGTIRDIEWHAKTGDMYMIGATGLENETYEYPRDIAAVIRVDKTGAYHPMGHDIKVEDPNKPRKVFQTLYLDETKDPVDIYIGGTFAFNGPTPTKTNMRVYNIAKWDHAAQDWVPIGSSIKTAWVDEKHFPNGYPGLPHRPDLFGGFLRKDFPQIRDITMDTQGRLYAVGTLAVLDMHTLPIKDRVETYGIARWNPETDKWEGPTKIGGFSRDPLQMTWLDEGRTQPLLSGAFEYDNHWRPLNGVAILDTTTGEIKALGGGLMPAHRDQVVAPIVRHAVRGNELWFAGLFDHAGINANATFAAPISSSYIAMYDPTKSMDPNAGLVVKPVAALPTPKRSSEAVKIQLEAELTEGEGTITWYVKRSGGKFSKKATGPKMRDNPRIRKTDKQLVYYVAVTRPDGSEGGKMPVVIKIGE